MTVYPTKFDVNKAQAFILFVVISLGVKVKATLLATLAVAIKETRPEKLLGVVDAALAAICAWSCPKNVKAELRRMFNHKWAGQLTLAYRAEPADAIKSPQSPHG